MTLRFLVDTHVAIRWVSGPKKLSREQTRVRDEAVKRREPVALSAITLLEIAALSGSSRLRGSAVDILDVLNADPLFQVLPMTFEIATEVALLGATLRDPADRAIIATARIHRLKLLTSDERIVESRLVPVVD